MEWQKKSLLNPSTIKKSEQVKTRKIVIVGNPNVGKSLIFSRITGRAVVSANYPGTTVVVKSGRFKYQDTGYELFDAPGIYSLEPFSDAEKTAIRLIDEADIILNVLDSTNLERNLNLTLFLLKLRRPIVVCLNFWDETGHKGITIDPLKLEKKLDLPVITTSALSGDGINDLVASLAHPRISNVVLEKTDHWNAVGSIVSDVQKLAHRHHTVLEIFSDFTLHPVWGLFSAITLLSLTFMIVRFIGEGMVRMVCDPLYSRVYEPMVFRLSSMIHNDILRDVLVGISGDPLQSFGIMTTGVYIAAVLVFPYFFSFYLMFGLLEDFGYLPRLAIVLDSFFHRLGLHGYSAIPIMLGLGCKVPAILALRTMSDRREKILTAALVLMLAPCLPQSVMIFSMGMRYGLRVVLPIFVILIILAVAVNTLLKKWVPGEKLEFFMEIPAYRLPAFRLLVRKLWTRITEYFMEVLPMIIIGVLVIHFLDVLGIIRMISASAGKLFAFMLGLPSDIASVMVLGFLRKDVSIALLAPFNLTASQFITASVFMVLYMPCIASFLTLTKEMGYAAAFKVSLIVFTCALITASILNLIFLLF
jgi:ferrous iron transport protein B